MDTLLPILTTALPLLPLLTGLVVWLFGGRAAAQISGRTALLTAALAGTTAILMMIDGPVTVRWPIPGGEMATVLALRLDAISAVMIVVVAGLGAAVLRFSRHYLAGDVAEKRFYLWMNLTHASVLTLVLAGHILLLFGAWVTTSLCLHRLLLLYPNRAGAVFSARKKFVFSRLGDACLLAAAILLYRIYGTGDFSELFAAIAAGKVDGLTTVACLLAACAALKSAQFPFHSWLPDTMETPTPVSAFMHAGIINAGGFLLIRFSPVLVHAPLALNLIAVIGALTAAFGAIVMLAQPSVKRALAYSTIAQMGFMLLQCGVGAFGLALVHLAAHSLYKAHAFLRSGSTVGSIPRAAIPLRTPALTLGLLSGALVITGVTTALAIFFPKHAFDPDVFTLILGFAIAYGLARVWSTGGRWNFMLRSVWGSLGIVAASLIIHAGAQLLFHSLPVIQLSPAVLVFIALTFTGLFFFQALLWRASHYALGRRLYVYAFNGFYIGTLANRALGRLWPRLPVAPL